MASHQTSHCRTDRLGRDLQQKPAASFRARRDPTDAAQRIPVLLGRLREQASYYASVRKDKAAAQTREMLAKTALAGVGAIALVAMIAVSVWLLLSGLARGLAILFGDRLWLGYSVTGLVLLAAIGLGTWLFIRHWRSSTQRRTLEKYERNTGEPGESSSSAPEPEPEEVTGRTATTARFR